MRSVLLILCCLLPAVVQAATIEQQRDWFVQAQQALNNHQMQSYAHLKQKLTDYPLTPYLDIWEVRKRLKQAGDGTVAKVLKRHADIPESYDLRRAWIKTLKDKRHWKQLSIQFSSHPGLKKRYPEIAMVTNWHRDRRDIAFKQFSAAWKKAGRFTRLSETLHQAWLKGGHPTHSELWARIRLLAGKGKWKSIKKLNSHLSRQQKQWLAYWRGMQGHEEVQLARWPASLSPPPAGWEPMTKAILLDGLTRLARKDPVLAWTSLQQLRTRVKSAKIDGYFDEIARSIALRAARRHMPEAAAWLAGLPAVFQNEDTRSWRARANMLAHDWPDLIATIKTMPAEDQQQARWQYWHGYALRSLGKSEQSMPYFEAQADERGYYSFLSADQLGKDYYFGDKSIESSPEHVEQIAKRPGIKRAHEWLALNKYGKAAREWYVALSGVDRETWKAAALLARQWQWPDQGIRAAYRAGKMNALAMRFPMHFDAEVEQAAQDTDLSRAEIWSIIRQESLFNRRAESPVGAKGLMQLMPKTAAEVARQMKLHGGHKKLYTPAVNIRLGSRYLSDMKSRFGDHLALAATAYNAGPGRVRKWLKRTPFDNEAIWVESIPFNETRRYVQHVMAYRTVYNWRINQAVAAKPAALALSLDEQLSSHAN